MLRSFDQAREDLARQYLDLQFDPTSGWSEEEFVAALEEHRAEHPDEPRILTRAWLFRLLCERGRIAVDPGDYFADKLEHHDLLLKLRDGWRRELTHAEFSGDPPRSGAWRADLDTGHTCPDWRSLLHLGYAGIRDRAKGRDGAFHQAVVMVYDGAITLVRRLAEAHGNPHLAALAERPPQTFREALQLACLHHGLQEMENGYSVRSMGRFDQLYNRFLVADLAAGRLTRDEAKELLKYFWIKFFAQFQGRKYGKPFLFGPEANELSYLAFEVYREMQVVDPKLHFRSGPGTPRDLFEQVVECVKAGCSGILFANDAAQVEMLQANGKALEDARDYVLIGCYEPAVMGQELNCSGSSSVNLAKVLELTLASAEPATFEAFFDSYLSCLDEQLTVAMDRVRRCERLWPEISPEPFLSGPMDSCFEQGLDVSQGGARYNTSGCLSAGLANVVDSLAVIEQLVYDQQACTLTELREALGANWVGHEHLRLQAMHRVPKWGNNDDRVDRLAVRLTDFLGQRINHEPNARGGVFQAALYAIIDTAKSYGKETGALPDGRLAGESLTMNTGATIGMDKHGVTSLINSVTKIDLAQFSNGTVLDVMLHPSVARGDEGTQTVCSLIETHFAQGGLALQFNIFDAAQLRLAQQHPERYANLQVRVCGWNVRFIDLGPDEQELFITKAATA